MLKTSKQIADELNELPAIKSLVEDGEFQGFRFRCRSIDALLQRVEGFLLNHADDNASPFWCDIQAARSALNDLCDYIHASEGSMS